MAVNNYFIWDDYIFLMSCSDKNTSGLFSTSSLRILGGLIFCLNYKLYGLDHTGYTITSIVVHIVNIMLVFLALNTITNDKKLSLLTAAIYASMSVYCDTIISKASLLTATNLTFYCLILILYVKGKQNRHFYYLSIALFFLAIFNKEEIASIPFIILFMELLFFAKFNEFWKIIKNICPYAVIIVAYIGTSIALSHFGIMPQEQFETLSKFRPLHSMIGGFASLIAEPDGVLTERYVLIRSVILVIIIPIALYASKNRKFLIFGLGWIFFTFLPQSYSNLTQYTPKNLFNSISRHLYIPSVGAAIVIAAIVLYSVKSQYKYAINITIFVLLSALLFYNAPLVHDRSAEWGDSMDARGMRALLSEIQVHVPSFERGAAIIIDNRPTGRAYMQRALRVFYPNDDVTYVDDPSELDMSKVTSLYKIEYDWQNEHVVAVKRLK
jgi:hypothetical protein